MSDQKGILSLPIIVVAALSGVVFASMSCGSSQPATSTTAAITGPVDMHCEMNDMEIKQSIGICMVVDSGTVSALSATDGAATDATITEAGTDANTVTQQTGGDAAVGDAGGDAAAPTSDFGATMYNSSGSDDDCKYNVKWTSTVVKENVGVTFDVNAIRRIDGKPATGANVQLEVFLNDHHPTPSNNIPNKESAGGNYQAGPVIFDQAGMWTVRFHFYEMCSDAPADSPHGHAAFYVNVP
jgi:hypothetical protein